MVLLGCGVIMWLWCLLGLIVSRFNVLVFYNIGLWKFLIFCRVFFFYFCWFRLGLIIIILVYFRFLVREFIVSLCIINFGCVVSSGVMFLLWVSIWIKLVLVCSVVFFVIWIVFVVLWLLLIIISCLWLFLCEVGWCGFS